MEEAGSPGEPSGGYHEFDYRHLVTRTYIDQTKALTEWRRSDPEASALPVCLQRATLKRLDEAYRGFFRRIAEGGKPGFPRFRGKGWFDSFGFRQFAGITLKSGRLRFQGMPGGLCVHLHRGLPEGAPIRSCTFKRDAKGWSVSFAVAIEAAAPRESHRAVGVDLGISTFAALSDGGFVPSLKAARKAERRLRVAQRTLARKQRGSGGRREARKAVARCHAAVARQRREHLHQASERLVPKDLADRHHDCPHRGLSVDRDLNAARNILNRAGAGPSLRNVAGCCGMRAGENLGSALRRRQEAVTPN